MIEKKPKTSNKRHRAKPLVWRQADLASHLRKYCDLKAGDVVMVHSSMKSIGWVEGGPDTVIRALQEVITPEGTLLMPALSYLQEGCFFQTQTPSRVGLITETFRTSAGVLRSKNPTHSVCGWGKKADAILAGHEKTTPTGSNSPFHKFALEEGKVLMIGCDMRTCTLIHVAESLATVPHLDHWRKTRGPLSATVVDEFGKQFTYCIKDIPTDSVMFFIVQEKMEKQREILHGRFGKARCLVFSAKYALDTATEILRENPMAFLCNAPKCNACKSAKKYYSE